MTNLQRFEFDGQVVRATGDGRFSVYDVLVAFDVCKKQYCRQTLNRIAQANSEVNTNCVNFKFPGRGQRPTPVADEQGVYQILMLCQGKRATEFRKWTAELFERYRKGDGSLAEEIVSRQSAEEAKRTAARIQGIAKRKEETSILREHGVTKGIEFANCTNATYKGLFGGTAKQLKKQRGLKKRDSLRDEMNTVELAALSFAEALAADDIVKQDLQGYEPCKNACYTNAADVSGFLEARRERKLT